MMARLLLFFSLFLCPVLRLAADSTFPTKTPIWGILIEGIDCSGKSTVCNLLEAKLRAKGLAVQQSDMYLSDNKLVKWQYEKALASNPADEPFYYASATLLDLTLFRPKPGCLYLQDRNWLTHISWTTLFGKECKGLAKDYIMRCRQSFSWNIYLKISYSTFKERCLHRPLKTRMNEAFFENEYQFNQYLDLSLSQIPKEENWLVIETDLFTPEEIAEKILNFCGIP